MPFRSGSALLVTLAIASAIPPQPVTAQISENFGPGRTGIGLSLGRHGLGIGVDIDVRNRIGLGARLEGVPAELTSHAVVGAGFRVDPFVSEQARTYALSLFGWSSCNRHGDSPVECEALGWRNSTAVIAGAEIRLTDSGSWWAGVEGGYWWGLGGGATDLNHITFAATFRVRP